MFSTSINSCIPNHLVWNYWVIQMISLTHQPDLSSLNTLDIYHHYLFPFKYNVTPFWLHESHQGQLAVSLLVLGGISFMGVPT